MHCGAVCPQEAVLYQLKDSIEKQPFPVIQSETFADDLKRHILLRRSYRRFQPELVDRNLITEALELAAWSPSAKNQHPTKWIVIESQSRIQKLMDVILCYVRETGKSKEIESLYQKGINVVCGESSTLLLAYAQDSALYPETDTVIAMTTVELYLQAKGVGTCWAGYLKRLGNTITELRALLPEIPEASSIYGAMMVGYPSKERYLHVPRRLKRADITWIEK